MGVFMSRPMCRKILLSCLIASVAQATPTIYPTKTMTSLGQLTNNTTSNVVADSVDGRRFYVMPPNSAKAQVSGLHSFGANMGFCKEMVDLIADNAELTQQIHQLTLDSIAAKAKADRDREALNNAKLEAADYFRDVGLEQLSNIDQNISVNQGRLDVIRGQKDSCSTNCDQLEKEEADLVDANRDLAKIRQKIVHDNAQKIPEYNKRKRKVDALEAKLKSSDDAFVNLKRQLLDTRSMYQQMYSSLGQMYGARAGVKFRSGWDDNVQALRNANPGFSFERIQTEDAQMFLSMTGVENIPGDAVMGYETVGQPIYADPVPGSNPSTKPRVLGVKFASYPAEVNGNVVLSLIGACPVNDPKSFGINLPSGTDEMVYGAVFSFNFPSLFTSSATATFNMSKMYQKIYSSGSSGGFFSSRSWSSVSETSQYSDSFKVVWDVSDPSLVLPRAQQLEVEDEMRLQIYQRMANLAMANSPNREAIIAAAAPPAHGSVVLADALAKTCPGSAYCVGASIALSVLDSIFGSSSSSSSYTSYSTVDQVESFSQSRVIMKPWVTGYN